MKISFLVFLFSALTFFGYTENGCVKICSDFYLEQPPEEREAFMQRIQSQKIAYFTEKLSLTPVEAEKFWPLYNTYNDERDRLRSEFIQKTRTRRGENERSEFDISKLPDAEARKLVNDRAKQIDLEKKFHVDLTKLFSPQRVLLFYHVEREFQRELLNRSTPSVTVTPSTTPSATPTNVRVRTREQ
jgi:hypothetical protein